MNIASSSVLQSTVFSCKSTNYVNESITEMFACAVDILLITFPKLLINHECIVILTHNPFTFTCSYHTYEYDSAMVDQQHKISWVLCSQPSGWLFWEVDVQWTPRLLCHS